MCVEEELHGECPEREHSRIKREAQCNDEPERTVEFQEILPVDLIGFSCGTKLILCFSLPLQDPVECRCDEAYDLGQNCDPHRTLPARSGFGAVRIERPSRPRRRVVCGDRGHSCDHEIHAECEPEFFPLEPFCYRRRDRYDLRFRSKTEY